jgi:hypothetical protein
MSQEVMCSFFFSVEKALRSNLPQHVISDKEIETEARVTLRLRVHIMDRGRSVTSNKGGANSCRF